MDRDEKQAFKRWLTTAGDKDLQMTLVKMQALEHQLTEADAIRDLRYMKKGTYREVEARRELAIAINNCK